MRGVYRFYQEGEFLMESENLLTTEGKRLILRVLAEQATSLGQAIGLGVGRSAPVVGDYRLNWEIDRAPISIKNVDYDNNLIIMKATLPQNSSYTIHEIGLWPQFTNTMNPETSAKIITTFDTSVEEWTNSTLDATQSRTSRDSIRIDASAASTTVSSSDVDVDLSQYSAADEFSVAFYKANNNITTLAITFGSLSGSYRRAITISSLPSGYNILSFKKGDFVATSAPDWSAVNKISVEVTAGATAGYLILDGIRVEDGDTPNPEYALVSRSVLPADKVLVKTDSAPMDIEYALEFNVT